MARSWPQMLAALSVFFPIHNTQATPHPEGAGQTTPPSCTMQNHGTTIIDHPTIIHVYLSSYWTDASGPGPALRAAHDASWQRITQSSFFWSSASEYGVQGGYWGGSYVLSDYPLPVYQAGTTASLSDGLYVDWALSNAINSNQIPTQYPLIDHTFYVFLLPPGWSDPYDISHNYIAHHGVGNWWWPSYGAPQGHQLVVYAIVESLNADSMNIVESHEIMEAATDSYTGGWYDNNGNEIGDLCFTNYSLGPDRIQTMWSQQACACVPQTPAPPTVFTPVAGNQSLTLSWTNSQFATNFNVKRSSGGGALATIATVAANITTYGDAGLTNGMTYYYTVSALDGPLESSNAPLVSGVPQAPPPAYCGDGTCNNGEACSTCPQDCGVCFDCNSCACGCNASSTACLAPVHCNAYACGKLGGSCDTCLGCQ